MTSSKAWLIIVRQFISLTMIWILSNIAFFSHTFDIKGNIELV